MHHILFGNILLLQTILMPRNGAKKAVCMFYDKHFSRYCTLRAEDHILGCPVLGQLKAEIHMYCDQQER